jgi:hypothetical protein
MPAQEVESALSADPQLVVQDAYYSNGLLSGQLTNNTGQPIKNVKVNYEILDAEGNIIDGGFVAANVPPIAPGESMSFRGAMLAEGSKVRVTFAEWSN